MLLEARRRTHSGDDLVDVARGADQFFGAGFALTKIELGGDLRHGLGEPV